MRWILAIALATSALAQSDPVSRASNQPVEPFKIIGNIYYVGASDVTSYLIVTSQGMIILDGGFVETAPMIRANIAELGFDFTDVKILLNSHAHYDHAGGLAELKRRTNAKFFASAGDIPMLARGGHDDPQFGDRFLFPPIEADRILHDGDRVTLGDTTLVAHITAGHTRGCTTWTTTVRDGSMNYNVVFVCSATIPSGYDIVTNPKYPNAMTDYRRTFATLRSLPCDVFLGSHANFFDMKEKRLILMNGPILNPFVDPKGYKEYVDAMEKRFHEVTAKRGPAE